MSQEQFEHLKTSLLDGCTPSSGSSKSTSEWWDELTLYLSIEVKRIVAELCPHIEGVVDDDVVRELCSVDRFMNYIPWMLYCTHEGCANLLLPTHPVSREFMYLNHCASMEQTGPVMERKEPVQDDNIGV